MIDSIGDVVGFFVIENLSNGIKVTTIAQTTETIIQVAT